jgi:hypothetical protein
MAYERIKSGLERMLAGSMTVDLMGWFLMRVCTFKHNNIGAGNKAQSASASGFVQEVGRCFRFRRIQNGSFQV